MDFYYWRNVDGEYGYNVLNILVEVDYTLLETGSWLKGDELFFLGKRNSKLMFIVTSFIDRH